MTVGLSFVWIFVVVAATAAGRRPTTFLPCRLICTTFFYQSGASLEASGKGVVSHVAVLPVM